ncbi:membrane protein [Tenacibaculum holothuriorum]|uniref:Membrane protein n=1 Tax=Tenacibaculum holothuriorum TaxID=1635173 RepID=A0A1Y2PCV4_9FLAO|nr:bestrophin family ion channel [Tenacibaculum holothuriorum]OSY88303.1 membrane protein [Tenacibaculum holothuriorum]
MYTKRNYSVKDMLSWTRRYIYIFIILSLIPVVLYTGLRWYWLHLPWLPIGLVGTALAFIISFKNNASYGRLWEARKIWGGIVNTSRSFAIMTNDFITNERAEHKLSEEELFKIRKQLIMRHVGWMASLRHALRAPKPWELSSVNKSDKEYMQGIYIREREMTLSEELEGYVSEEEKDYILKQRNKQGACLKLQSNQLRELKEQGYIWEFAFLDMEKILVEFFTLQGKVERIKNFPYPRQFATLNRFFIWIFVILLPYGMMHEFNKIGRQIVELTQTWKPYPEGGYHHLIELIGEHFVWFTIPFSVVISWIFHTMERIGEVSENPFEGIANDVPITTMSRGIEIDIRQIIGDDENEIPEPVKDSDGVQM